MPVMMRGPTYCMPVMMRGPIVRQLCVGRYRETNKEKIFLTTTSQLNVFFAPVVYYLSEGFKTRLESFGANIG